MSVYVNRFRLYVAVIGPGPRGQERGERSTPVYRPASRGNGLTSYVADQGEARVLDFGGMDPLL